MQRRAIRSSLTEWARLAGFEPARHHGLLIRELEAITRGGNDRLAIFMPPGSAKSTYASRLFPPWFLAQNPTKSVIAASHTAELAEKWGRSVRNLVQEHAQSLGFGIAKDNQAAGRWATNKGGEYLASGVGGAIAGFRADLGLIDDPVRSREDADSELIRERTWEWYRTDFYTRLKPGAAIVLVQTRWHEDDLAGRILASEGDKRDGGQWRVISLPAIAMERDPLGRAPGEALWPEWEPIDHLERKRTVVGPRAWLSLYQQSPTAEEGTYFQRDWWRYYDALPRDLNIYMSGDFAVTDSGGDYTELAVWGVDPTGDLYALDWWSGQETADVWCDALLDRVDRWKPLRFIGETGPIRRAVEPFLDRRMRERRVYTATEWMPTSNGSKEARARPFQAMTATGRVFWPRKEWAERVLDQCLRFPAGKHDDAVDTCALIGAYLDKTWAATRTPEPKPAVIADRFVAGDFFQPPKAASW